jgi:hypothetical protein
MQNEPAGGAPLDGGVRPRADGGAAFPVLPPCDMEGASAQGYPYPEAGMTLRDYFAAKAMQSVLRDPYFSEKADTMGHSEFADEVAEAAYTVADAMLRFRAA